MNKKNAVLSSTLLALLLLAAPGARAGESHISGDEYLAADVLTGVVPLGAFWLTYLKDDKPGRKQYLWSMGTSLIVVNGARLAFKDHEWGTRPNGHPYGFPSGHLVFISSGAAFLQDRYGWKWGVPAWGTAYYTAWVRVEDEHHRWRDIGVATAVSVLASQYFVSRHPDTTVKPLFGLDKVFGLQLEHRFGG
jgi:hypothetical protein